MAVCDESQEAQHTHEGREIGYYEYKNEHPNKHDELKANQDTLKYMARLYSKVCAARNL
jgi:hypothetical protein